MKEYLKEELRHLPVIIVMFIVFYSAKILATTVNFDAGDVPYNNSSGVQSTDVQGAVDELYTCATNYSAFNTRYNTANTTIGNETLTTTNQTLTSAVNELDSKSVKLTGDQTIFGPKMFVGGNVIVQSPSSQYTNINTYGDNKMLYGQIQFDSGDADNLTKSQLSFIQYSPNSTPELGTTEYYEKYSFPAVNVGRTANATYSILTSKNAVTVAQGGTGATTAAAARTNLEAAGQSDLDTANNLIAGSVGTIAKSSSKVLKSTAAAYYVLVTTGSASAMNGMWLVRMSTSTIRLIEVKAASNVTLTTGTGQITIANGNTSKTLTVRVIPLGYTKAYLTLT